MIRTLAVLIVLLAASPVRAAHITSFSVQRAAWGATSIVVTDAKGRVVESWAGDLKPGDALPAEVLKEIILDHPVGGSFRRHDLPQQRVSGNRLVWFLRKDKGGAWSPSAFSNAGKFDTSVAWVEHGSVYALVQHQNPGPQEMVLIARDEGAFKKDALNSAALGSKYRDAVAEPDATKRAEKLDPFVTTETLGTHEAIRLLSMCGAAGVKVLDKVMCDAKRRRDHPRAIKALGVIGPPAAPVLYRILKEEREYWDAAVARGVTAEWVNDANHTSHKDRLVAALTWGTAFAYPTEEQRQLIDAVGNVWQTHPVLSIGWKTNEGQNGRGWDGFGHPGYHYNVLAGKREWW